MVRNLVLSRVFSLFLLIIASLILTACPGTKPSGRFTLRIVTANVKEQQEGGSERQVAERLYESGSFIDRELQLWTFITANELAADELGGPTEPHRFREKTLDCPFDEVDTELVSINCLVGGLNDADYLVHQKGEVGIIARGQFIDQLQVNGESFISELIGPERAGGIQRRFIASRFRIKSPGRNVLLVSIHLSHGGTDAERKEELEDLIQNIKSMFVPGDLTPILAGDFNCHSWSSGLRAAMYRDFMIATTNKEGWPDHVFIGRPQSFPNNGGVLLPVENTTVKKKPMDRNGKELSDHIYVRVDLEYDPNNQPTFLPPPVTTEGDGCTNP